MDKVKEDLAKVSQAVYLACDAEVADDISQKINAGRKYISELESALECMIILYGKDDSYDGGLLPKHEQEDTVRLAMNCFEKYNDA